MREFFFRWRSRIKKNCLYNIVLICTQLKINNTLGDWPLIGFLLIIGWRLGAVNKNSAFYTLAFEGYWRKFVPFNSHFLNFSGYCYVSVPLYFIYSAYLPTYHWLMLISRLNMKLSLNKDHFLGFASEEKKVNPLLKNIFYKRI
jgi:hypothetical protein